MCVCVCVCGCACVRVGVSVCACVHEYTRTLTPAHNHPHPHPRLPFSVAFLLDEQEYASDALLSPGLANFQGPALCCFNNASFSERDFSSITSIGSSGKARDSATIGRFGLGFNTVFHLTDIPSFVSADSLCIFDPHGKSLPGQLVGARFRLASADSEQVGDTLAPFTSVLTLLGAPDLGKEPIASTLFRLPLRSPAQAAVSEVSPIAHSAADVLATLHELAAASPELLLFLQNVRQIRILHRRAGDQDAHILRDVKIEDFDAATPQISPGEIDKSSCFARRAMLRNFAAASAQAETEAALVLTPDVLGEDVEERDASGQVESLEQNACGSSLADANYRGLRQLEISETFEMTILDSLHPDKLCHRVTWLVSGAVERAPQELADAAEAQPVRWAAVAMKCDTSVAPAIVHTTRGRLYCFLPIPAESDLPVHVHASFALTTARTPVSIGHGAHANDSRRLAQAEWNTQVMHLGARCYARLLSAAAHIHAAAGRACYHGWPRHVCATPQSHSDELAKAVLIELHLRAYKVLRDVDKGKLHAISDALLNEEDDEVEVSATHCNKTLHKRSTTQNIKSWRRRRSLQSPLQQLQLQCG